MIQFLVDFWIWLSPGLFIKIQQSPNSQNETQWKIVWFSRYVFKMIKNGIIYLSALRPTHLYLLTCIICEEPYKYDKYNGLDIGP